MEPAGGGPGPAGHRILAYGPDTAAARSAVRGVEVGCRIIDHAGPLLALNLRRRFRTGTVLIVDGTLAPPATTRSPSGRRTTATPPTTKSSSVLTPDWSSWSAGPCRATGTTARPGRSQARRPPSAGRRPSPTAAVRAPAWSSRTAGPSPAGSPSGRPRTTASTSRSELATPEDRLRDIPRANALLHPRCLLYRCAQGTGHRMPFVVSDEGDDNRGLHTGRVNWGAPYELLGAVDRHQHAQPHHQLLRTD